MEEPLNSDSSGAQVIRSVHGLDVCRLSFAAAMEILAAAKSFPSEERYSLTDQIRRSSRSVAASMREGFTKRRHKSVFANHLTGAWSSAEETRTWLDFALQCDYPPAASHTGLSQQYDRICAMLFRLQQQWAEHWHGLRLFLGNPVSPYSGI